ncbi:Importin alpha re-exporter [Paragonimus heterotremus]|uniref:Exportin-2 n=1 Tax=Paragonimus heterotremus TaxID=100268 RepID=A0A8J4SIL8_9TREM|nr:Importin alpha re-exporter [Paragonimus heterotremus]
MDQGAGSYLLDVLHKTLSADPTERKTAETYLKSVELQPSYSAYLLEIVLDNSCNMSARLAAAIVFKNFIKTYWKTDADMVDKISVADRNDIRSKILGALLSVSGGLQPQLSEAIGAIWREDFPHKWPSLIPDLVDRMVKSGADLNMVKGVLQTAHTLFKRYRHECAGNELFREMKAVIDQFGAPLTELAKNLLALVVGSQCVTNGTSLAPVFHCLLLVCKIFLSLNCQDLPEFFEDNMADWMAVFRTLLQLDISITQLVDSATHCASAEGDKYGGVSIVEQVKSQVCDNISLYASKYEVEFSPYLTGFVTDVWELLIATDGQAKYDVLIGNAIEFLSCVINRPQHRHLFESAETLQKLCEKVVLPNMQFRDTDEELFSNNPEEYLRLDLDGSDTHTRRRAACHLVHALCQAFEGPVVTNFSTYIEHLLNEYSSKSDGSAWLSKDAALLLVTSVAARGKTEKLGVTVSTKLVDIPTFYESHVLPELEDPNVDGLPVIKADCMRYAIAFRSLLPPLALIRLINLTPLLLTASAPVVHSYAAALLDKLLSVKRVDSALEPVVTKEQIIDPQLLLQRLLSLVLSDSTENVYVMRALMRTCCCLQERCLPSMNSLVSTLISKLSQVAKNPCNPNFNHYLLETICLCIQTTCAADSHSVVHFESALFPIFQEILQNDISEFVPYVFQLLSVMLEQYPMSKTVIVACESSVVNSGSKPSAPYAALLPRLLIPPLWDQRGNVPALCRLMQSYVLHNMEEVLASNKLSAMLGVYQRLIASVAHDAHSLLLLDALVVATPKPLIQPYLRQVFIVIFRRLQTSKTEKFMKALVWFVSRFVLVYSPNELIQLIDEMQPNLFGRVLEKVLLPFAESAISMPLSLSGSRIGKGGSLLSARVHWHQISVGLIRLVGEGDALFGAGGCGLYADYFAPLVGGIAAGLEAGPGRGGESSITAAIDTLSQTTTKSIYLSSEEQFVDLDTDLSGGDATFGQLTLAVQRIPLLRPNITDPRLLLANTLHQLAAALPGRVGPILNARLEVPVVKYLQSCLDRAGVVLP